MQTLPNELWREVLQNLENSELKCMRMVCRSWRVRVDERTAWKLFVAEGFEEQYSRWKYLPPIPIEHVEITVEVSLAFVSRLFYSNPPSSLDICRHPQAQEIIDLFPMSSLMAKLTKLSIELTTATRLEPLHSLNLKILDASCGKYSLDQLRFLPTSLEELDVSEPKNQENVSLQYLPQSLRMLDLSGCCMKDDETQHFTKLDRLETLKLRGCQGITGKDIHFPNSLKYLDICWAAMPLDRLASRWPSKLENLQISKSYNLYPSHLLCLPTTLTRLKLAAADLSQDGHEAEYLTFKTRMYRLNYLKLFSCNKLTWQFLRYIPTSVEYLAIEGLKVAPLMPSEDLRSLSVKILKIKVWHITDLSDVKWLYDLPPTLELLILEDLKIEIKQHMEQLKNIPFKIGFPRS